MEYTAQPFPFARREADTGWSGSKATNEHERLEVDGRIRQCVSPPSTAPSRIGSRLPNPESWGRRPNRAAGAPEAATSRGRRRKIRPQHATFAVRPRQGMVREVSWSSKI